MQNNMEQAVCSMTIHLEVLPGEQIAALRRLAPAVTPMGWYLAGGTAIAMQLGHRHSIDFDWFTNGRLQDPLLLAATLREIGINFVTRHYERGTLHGTVDNVRTSFIEYHYHLLHPLLECLQLGCSLASLFDLACMKLSAVAQRGSRKDFIDIYALLKNGFNLKEMFEMYQEKYEITDISHLYYGLTFFDNADNEPMPHCIWDIEWEAIKHIIKNEVFDAVKRVKVTQ
jgi:hypothetical protein